MGMGEERRGSGWSGEYVASMKAFYDLWKRKSFLGIWAGCLLTGFSLRASLCLLGLATSFEDVRVLTQYPSLLYIYIHAHNPLEKRQPQSIIYLYHVPPALAIKTNPPSCFPSSSLHQSRHFLPPSSPSLPLSFAQTRPFNP